MISKKVYRYYADCGRAFWTKRSCLKHESNCTCWKNPKFKTCLTCEHKKFVKNWDDTEHGTNEWIENDCKNPNFYYDKHFNAVHPNADHICINCPIWELKK